MVPISLQCPQEIVPFSLPPSVLLGTAISSKFLSQLSSRNVAVLRGSLPLKKCLEQLSAIPCRSSASGHRASSSKHTRGQSRETGSLSTFYGSVETPAKCISMGFAQREGTRFSSGLVRLCSTGYFPLRWAPCRLW